MTSPFDITYCSRDPDIDPEFPWLSKAEASAFRGRNTMTKEQLVATIIRSVCELPGYTSPDTEPDLLQCTTSELQDILERVLPDEPPPGPSDAVVLAARRYEVVRNSIKADPHWGGSLDIWADEQIAKQANRP